MTDLVDTDSSSGARRLQPLKRIATIMLLLIPLTACGEDDSGAATSPESVSEELGCSDFTKEDTEEIFVRSLYSCDDTSVYFFNTGPARDSWLEAAEEFGAVIVDRGDTWVQVES